MWRIGVDLHHQSVVLVTVHDSGGVTESVTFSCQATKEKVSFQPAAKSFIACEHGLRQWYTKLASTKKTCGDDSGLAKLRTKNQRLRRELRRAELEREILKYHGVFCKGVAVK